MDIKNVLTDEIEAYFETLTELEIKECINQVINEFEQTISHARRNSLAFILAEYADSKAVDSIIKMLNDPKTKGSRGTLIYVLTDLDYYEHLEFLLSLWSDEGFEVKREVFNLLEKALDCEKCDIDSVKKIIFSMEDRLQEDNDFYISVLELLEKN